jgi:hypothetical protein
MDSSNQALADATKLNNDLFELVEKLRIQLNEKDEELQGKDEELAKEKQEKEVCNFFRLQVYRTK